MYVVLIEKMAGCLQIYILSKKSSNTLFLQLYFTDEISYKSFLIFLNQREDNNSIFAFFCILLRNCETKCY